MKKIILFLVSVLFILTGCSNNNKLNSLNGFLKYELPEGWTEIQDYQGVTEIAIEKEDRTTGLMIEYIEYSYDEPEGFISYQEEALLQSGATFKDEKTIEENDKKIVYKNYEVSSELGSFIFTVGTIEYNKNQDVFLGFMGTLVGETASIDEVLNILNTIEFTDIKLNEKRKISSDNEYVEFMLSEGWRRFERTSEYSFYKSLDEGFLYSYISTYSKNDKDPKKEFEDLGKNFEASFPGSKVYIDESTQEVDGKTITSKVYEYDLDGLLVYTYINIIEFKDSNLFAISNFDIAVEGGFETVKDELEGIVKSINLKKGADKQFEKDHSTTETETQTLEDIAEESISSEQQTSEVITDVSENTSIEESLEETTN